MNAIDSLEEGMNAIIAQVNRLPNKTYVDNAIRDAGVVLQTQIISINASLVSITVHTSQN